MSKRLLTLIRHAEAGSEHGSRIRDCDRPLTEQGRKDAMGLGARLADLAFEPDGVWTSDAERALSTTRILADSMALGPADLDIRSGLYLAHMSTLRDSIREADADIQHLVVVGHNPGLSELWDWLCDKHGFGLPTCGIAHLQLKISRWSQLERGCGDLIEVGGPGEDSRS
jgi:phosphohistidine phosphatase